jgi:uncharacterized protein YkwD
MKMMKGYKIVLSGLLIVMACSFTMNSGKKVTAIDKEAILEQHNYYRDQVGVPHLQWSDELAEYAQNWADKLAKKCNMYHSSGPYGENIYWTSGTASETEIVDYWATEQKYFNHRNPTYKKGSGRKSGHYSQIIWRSTTHVGGAVANCKHGGQIWVCNYDPHGNIIGRKAY